MAAIQRGTGDGFRDPRTRTLWDFSLTKETAVSWTTTMNTRGVKIVSMDPELLKVANAVKLPGECWHGVGWASPEIIREHHFSYFSRTVQQLGDNEADRRQHKVHHDEGRAARDFREALPHKHSELALLFVQFSALRSEGTHLNRPKGERARVGGNDIHASGFSEWQLRQDSA